MRPLRYSHASSAPQAHKKSCVDVFNEFMIASATLVGYYGIPLMEGTASVPNRMTTFSRAMSRGFDDWDQWVCFYEHDVHFECFWHNPKKYLTRLRRFRGVISPDYSLYADFSRAQQIWNTHRNYACGAWLQSEGLDVIANVRTAGWDSSGYTLAAAPHHSTIAIGSNGCLKNRAAQVFINDLRMTVDVLKPTHIVVYGTDAYGAFDYPRSIGIPVTVFPSVTWSNWEVDRVR